MPGLGFAPLDATDHNPTGPASVSENDLSTIIKRLEVSRNYDNFFGELAKLNPNQARKWQDIQGLIGELDKCNDVHHSFLNSVSEIVMKYRIDEKKQDAAVLESITELVGYPADTMTKIFDSLTRETNKLMAEKLTCEGRLLEFENGIKSIKSCIEATRSHLSTSLLDNTSEIDPIKKFIEASAEMTASMVKIAEERISAEAKRLFDINHRLMMLQYWTKANHIRGDTCACSICYTTNVNAFFQDCGHTGCHDCLQKLDKCPWCRGPARIKKMFFNGPESTGMAPPQNEGDGPLQLFPIHPAVGLGRLPVNIGELGQNDLPENLDEILWEAPVPIEEPQRLPTVWNYIDRTAQFVRNFIHGMTMAL